MSDFIRYAIYHLPAPGPLARFGAEWLGWDVETGTSVPALGPQTLTDAPRKYGFHATLKPPFRLAEGTTVDALLEAVSDIAAKVAPVRLEGVGLARIGRFLALTPLGDTTALGALAARIVTELDPFRAPASEADLARRRAAGLSARQEENLVRWGYPYVMEEFRFHMTLTGKAEDPAAAEALLAPHVARLPLAPYVVGRISLVGERRDGMFEAIHHCTLSG